MEHSKFTTIAHSDHIFCSPLSSSKVDQILELLNLLPREKVLDIGCGKAEILVRLIKRFQVYGVGIDTNSHFLSEAKTKVLKPEELVLHEMDVANFAVEPESFALAMCVGSTHAYGGYRSTLRALKDVVRARGQLLIGELYWKCEPDPNELSVMGAAKTDYVDHAGNVAIGVEEGLIPLYASVSSEDDWDHYEWLYCRGIEQYAIAHPDDPDCKEMIPRIRQWRDAYLRWRRHTLGFALYLFQKP
jgi:ubiquinone/menaquinone biosynthesis C-methylase UbiE